MTSKPQKIKRSMNSKRKIKVPSIPSNLSEIMKANLRDIDLENVIKKEFEKQMELDEQNELKFYNIVQDRNGESTNNGKKFKSVHSVSDMIQLKGLNVKFFQKKPLSFYEKLARQDIKKKPEGGLLLNEIYQKLDENYVDAPKIVIKTLQKKEMFEVKNDYKPEADEDLVRNLGIWKRKFKMSDSINKGTDRERNIDDLRSPKDANNYNSPTLNSAIFIKESISEKSAQKPKFENTLKEEVSENRNSKSEDFSSLDKLPPINYKNQDVVLQFSENFESESYDIESLEKQTQIFFKCKPDFSTLMQNAFFYERYSNAIQEKINKKMRDLEAILVSKSKNMQTLRMENFRINEKKLKIQSLMQKLKGEIEVSLKDPLLKINYEKTLTQNNSPRGSDYISESTVSPNESNNSFRSIGDKKLSLSIINKFKQLRRKNKMSYEQLDSLMEKKSEENKFRESQIKTLADNYAQYWEKRIYNDRVIESIEKEILAAEKELKKYQKFKVKFIYDLLKNGKDVRNEGLSWIIRFLWNAGDKVLPNQMPDFLDSKAKEYLLQKSKRESELKELETLEKNAIENYKTNMLAEGVNLNLSLDKSILDKELKGELDYGSSDIGEGDIINDSNYHNGNISELKIPDPSFLKDDYKHESSSVVNQTMNSLEDHEMGEEKKRAMSNKSLGKSQGEDEIIKDPFEEGLKKLIYKDTVTNQNLGKKSTLNDKIYAQTKDKIKEMLVNPSKDNSTLWTSSQEKISLTFDVSGTQQFDHHIILVENSDFINNYHNREDFIQEYEILRKKLKEKQLQLKKFQEEEIKRIIREFEFREYGKRFNVNSTDVILALVGARDANSALIRLGVLKSN